MKFGLLCLSIMLFLLTACSLNTKKGSDFIIRRGINISHWLSQSDRRGEARTAWFTEKDVITLRDLGFDHLRIPIDEEQMWDEEGRMMDEAFDLLNRGLDWCEKYNLRAVVDLHILRAHYFNAEEIPLWTDPDAQEHFLDCWRDLSARLKDRPKESVAYELMNEAVAEDPEDWNRLLARAYGVIRKNEPDRVIIIGSNRWQIPDTFDVLKVPADDPNIILSFHFYTPMVFTHYKAPWWRHGCEYSGPVKYPGQIIDEHNLKGYPDVVVGTIKQFNGFYQRDVFEAELEKPLTKARALGLPLFCGEWGSLPTTPEKDWLKWYEDVRAIFEKHGIAWALWDYKGDFGIVEKGGGAPKEKLIEVLLD
ncbi:cellulase family glycosylhydrolase [bacterium]|nr:cellulase family glycosylhydrolase [bacterium]